MREPIVLTGALLVASAVAASRTASGVEEPAFRVALAEGEFEIRQYPPVILAETLVEGEWRAAGNTGFRRLANYIFGGNAGSKKIPMTAPVSQSGDSGKSRKGQKIAMTAPVAQGRSGDSWIVAFTMPSGTTLESLPVPDDPDVQLRTVGERRIGAIRFSGTWDEKRFEAKTAELSKWLESKGEKTVGEPVTARYNPPWTPWFMRRNEILFELAVRFPG
jgi:hypothetical protein